MTPRAREVLEAIYRDVDREILECGVRCERRGDCCDFRRRGHRLYASSLEIAYVKERHPAPFPSGNVLCPFWKGGACAERERRPLGCRTYFCDPRYRRQLEEIYERYHRRIRQACEGHAIPYRYEPFVAALREP
jgi:hypothetical protein